MKAVTYQGFKNIKVKKVKDPIIEQDDDVIIKVTSTSICGSDLHIYHGLIPGVNKGHVIGHETMGIIVATGKEVNHIKKGDRIIVPFPVSCGHCYYCEHELWSQCDDSNVNGEVGAVFGYGKLLGGYDGGQAEYLRVPYANVGPTIVPEYLSDEEALFLTDALTTAYWGAEQANVRVGDTVVVLGSGPIGLLTQKCAAYMGAGRIIAVDHVDYRLNHAKTSNGVEVVNFNDYKNTGEYIKEITNGGADAVIDCVGLSGKMSFVEKLETALKIQGGSKSAIEIASQAVRKGGNVSLVGVYGARYNNFPLGDFFSRNITLKMGQCPVHSYVDPLMNLVKEKKIDPTDIITHKLPLYKSEQAYKLFNNKEEDCIKVILKP
ncbi:zinc-dependent alcohol dehydrogenase [Haloplasma contractile]|uniref:Alcohol dehydrogenase protein n=1 Tax=Haloplasma contractile SSD-17B TaxID=1033810 RepID=F7Q0R0_9MOLU|nr:zinc-dependent alcohol dehydrogenase [Haloplasma contractile]ERJ11970.1 alcohol dehydrogenase protein [Haloplasma contractile SSD-17B]